MSLTCIILTKISRNKYIKQQVPNIIYGLYRSISLTFFKCAVFVFISLKRFSRFSWNGLRAAETRFPCKTIPSSKIST